MPRNNSVLFNVSPVLCNDGNIAVDELKFERFVAVNFTIVVVPFNYCVFWNIFCSNVDLVVGGWWCYIIEGQWWLIDGVHWYHGNSSSKLPWWSGCLQLVWSEFMRGFWIIQRLSFCIIRIWYWYCVEKILEKLLMMYKRLGV